MVTLRRILHPTMISKTGIGHSFLERIDRIVDNFPLINWIVLKIIIGTNQVAIHK